jgi:hypothetical protein
VDIGEVLTRSTVWLALSFYVAAEAIRSGSDNLRRKNVARFLNTLGCTLFIAHVACAFHFYHHWSHAAAYAETARQTAQYFGVNSGSGLYFNYLFLVLWIIQVIASWMRPATAQPLARWLTWTVRGFVLIMAFNGAVVFAHGFIRWFGLLLCILLLVSWRRSRSAGN